MEPIGPGPRDTERRRITVMFADITNFTKLVERSSQDRAFEIVTDCLRLLDGIARRHGGSVDKYLGDCVMAVFGLPTALEDAPRAAVNAAIEMVREVRAFNRTREMPFPLDVHIGIGSGRVISGDVSGPVLREFAVLGDVVNVASRLKDKAPPGRIYVGLDTYRHTHGSFDFEEVDVGEVKGKSERVRAFALVSERPRPYRTRGSAERSIFSELVGRDEEIRHLVGALRAARDGGGAIVTIVGEAGLGKTRLVEEFLHTPGCAAARHLVGRSIATGRTLAYHPFADLFRSWAGIDDDASPEGARDALERSVAALALEDEKLAGALLARLVGLAPTAQETEILVPIQDEAMETRILWVARAALERMAASSPLILIFEDLHWADASSISLLEGLLPLASALPVLFLLVYRPGFSQTGGRLDDTVEREHAAVASRVVLAPLTREAVTRLLRNLCRGGRVPPEFLARLEDKAAGNPFFVAEVVRALLEQGALVQDELGIHAAPSLAYTVVPDTIHAVLLGRIDRLPREAKHLLQLAAVIGRSFDREVIASMRGNEDRLDGLLAELVAAELVTQGSGRTHVFCHPLVQEVAYESILGTRLEDLHRAAAKAIETHLGQSMPGYHAMLAYHYGRTKDAERAEECLFRAGQEATELAAADEALVFFKDAARLYFERHGDRGDPEKKAELEWNIARAHANRGDMVDTIEHTNRALRLLGDDVPSAGLALTFEAIRGAFTVARALYLPAPRRDPATPRDLKVIELRLHRARAQTTADPARFARDSLRAFRKLWKVDPASVEGAGAQIAGLVGPVSFSGISLGLGKRALELARPLVGKTVNERFLFALMEYLQCFLAGEWDASCEIDADLVDEALKLGMLWDVTNYLGFKVEKLAFQGAFAAADEQLAELRRIADHFRYGLARSTFRAQTTFLLLEQGRLREAREAADEYYLHHPDQLLSLLALGARAKIRALEGDLDGAAHDADAADRVLADAGFVSPYHASSVRRSRLLVDVMQLEQALSSGSRGAVRTAKRRAAASSARALRSVRTFAARRPEILRLEGVRCSLSGRHRSAARAFDRSIAEAERIGARGEWGRTRLERGIRLAQSAPVEAAEDLKAAEQIFKTVGLEADLDRVFAPGLELRTAPTFPDQPDD